MVLPLFFSNVYTRAACDNIILSQPQLGWYNFLNVDFWQVWLLSLQLVACHLFTMHSWSIRYPRLFSDQVVDIKILLLLFLEVKVISLELRYSYDQLGVSCLLVWATVVWICLPINNSDRLNQHCSTGVAWWENNQAWICRVLQHPFMVWPSVPPFHCLWESWSTCNMLEPVGFCKPWKLLGHIPRTIVNP